MNKRLNTYLIIVCIIILVTLLSFSSIKLLDYIKSSSNLKDIDIEKENCTVSNRHSFINDSQKYHRQSLSEESDDEEYNHKYMMGDIAFISYTDKWDEDKLEELSKELLKNVHGEELNYVSKIKLVEQKNSDYIGFQETTKETHKIPFSFYNLMPSDSKFTMSSNLSVIALMGAGSATTIEEMAPILSHEYGHHFIEYHFGITYTNRDKTLKYFRLRGAGDDRIRFSHADSYKQYLNNHMWYLFEIGAEDYAYLMGSDTGKPTVEFYDSYDKLKAYSVNEYRYNAINYTYVPSRNGTPHENTALPMPSDVPGLAEYFYSFVDEEPPEFTKIEPIGDLNLEAIKSGSNSYTIKWDQPYTDDDIIYTLLVCDEYERLGFIAKTAWGSETGQAKLGAYEIKKGSWVYNCKSGIEKGTPLIFKVSITFPDGTVVVSDSMELTF